MKSAAQATTLEWIQAKYGIALLFAGVSAIAIDNANAQFYVMGPIIGGLTVAILTLLSKRLARYHYTPLQFNTGIFLYMFFWTGSWVATNYQQLHEVKSIMLFCPIAVCCLSYLAVFFTSCPYQDEIEELEGR